MTGADSRDARVAEVLDLLSSRGMRRTSARQAILEAIFASDAHVTAEDIAAEVHRRFPSVDVSTVYRTLVTLEELGIIDHTISPTGPPSSTWPATSTSTSSATAAGGSRRWPSTSWSPFSRR